MDLLRDEECAKEIDFKVTPRLALGLFLMLFSYVIGWPAVSLFAFLAWYFNEAMIALIGGPLIYGTSHLMFIAGVYCAGSDYARILLRRGLRKLLEKYPHERDPELLIDDPPSDYPL